MRATLDRVEGETAVLLLGEDERLKIKIPAMLLPEGSREGDVMEISITRDEKATKEARSKVSDLIDKLKKRSDL